MTLRNFQHSISAADKNGNINIDDVEVIRGLGDNEEVKEYSIVGAFKKEKVLPILQNHGFIVFYDKLGKGYSRIII